MKVDCQWFNANLEAFFCDSLDVQKSQLASEHLKTCLSCRNEVQSLREVDPLIRQLLKYRMTKVGAAARAPKRSFGFRLGLAGAAAALLGILILAVFLRRGDEPGSVLPTDDATIQASASPNSNDPKIETVPPNSRAKPDAPVLDAPGPKPIPEPEITDNSPSFLVTDPAGYSTSLEDYRGRVLLIGVWSAEQPEAAQSIQKLYQTFGNRKGVRVLGVTSRNTARPAGLTFPIVFNNGSRLMDTKSPNFVIVDKEGKIQLRGSLVSDANSLTTKVRAKLDELGGK